jgi:S-DNA-T family DNA segregation ATPase FtsK/SpoIIIE
VLTFTLRRRHTSADPNPPRTDRSTAPTEQEVTAALCGLGISALTRAIVHGGHGFAYITPITRDGHGWTVGIDLPYGVTAGDVMTRRPALACGLRRPIGAVWPTPQPDIHPGRLNLWIAEQPIHRQPQARWPLAGAATADLAAPIPLGTDAHGRLVNLTLAGNHVLVAGSPRTGVGNTLRLLGHAAALDPAAELHLFDPRGAGDFTALGRLASTHLTGCDEQDTAAMLAELRELRQQVCDRLAHLKTLPPATGGDGSTRARSLGAGQHRIVIVIDEAQEILARTATGAEGSETITDLLRLGAAVNVTVIAAVGNPDQARLPASFWAGFPTRICHRVHSPATNDLVLGRGSYAHGMRATDLTAHDNGVAIVAGPSGEHTTARVFWTARAFPGTGENR